MLTEDDRRQFLRRFRSPKLDNMKRQKAAKEVNSICRKSTYCPYCGAINGVTKKAGVLKIVHERFRSRKTLEAAVDFRKSFDTAIQLSKEIQPHLSRAHEDMNPLRVLDLFKKISAEVLPNLQYRLLLTDDLTISIGLRAAGTESGAWQA